jgi:peroxiredoxin
MKSLEDNHAKLDSLNAVALGIGVDSVPSNKAWAESMAVKNTSLLSDFWPHGEVAKSYGVFREREGSSERANILVDEEGKVVFAKTYPIAQQPDMEEIVKFLQGGRK